MAFRNESYKLFFSWRCSKCPNNKIVHNFLIKNSNGMNQNFLNRQKYNPWEKKQIFAIFFCCPSPLYWAYLGITFVPGHQLKKYTFPRSLSIFLSSKKVLKNHNKNSARRYLSKIPFVPWIDNSLLGVKKNKSIHWRSNYCVRPLLFAQNSKDEYMHLCLT